MYDLLSIGSCVLYALLVGFLLIVNPKLGAIAAILPLFTWFVIIGKKNTLYLLFLFAPFQASPFLSQNLLNIPGAKPFSLISVMALIVCFYHGGELFFQPGTTRRKVMVYLGIYFTCFSLAAFRSLNYLNLLHMLDPEQISSSPVNYLLSFYVKPSLYLVSFIYIINHITSEEDIEKTSTFLCSVLGLISIVIILLSFSHGTVGMVRERVTVWGEYFGYHYNTIGSFYIILGPLVIVRAIKKRFWDVFNWCLALMALALLQSRSSLLIFLFANVLMLFFLRNTKELIALFTILLLFSLYYLPRFLLDTLVTGFGSGNLDAIFTGRIDYIWIPLITEWLANPILLLFGKGQLAMLTSQAYLKGTILRTISVHNAFLEFFADNGIILLSLLIFYLIKFLKLAWHNVKLINHDIGWALLTSIICYLSSTISGRSFYPSSHNFFLFPIIALMINYLRLHNSFLSQNVIFNKSTEEKN